nr:hypothetical protein [Hyphomicrobium sp.]
TPSRPGFMRDRLAMIMAVMTAVGVALALVVSKGTQILMPGPLASVHGGIEKCSACHTQSGSGKLSWVHGLVPRDPHADSKSCLTCHKMPDTAFNAHGAAADVLQKSTERLTKIVAQTPQPRSVRAQSTAFPTHDMEVQGLTCATCHQEHQGVNFKLTKLANEQCQSCHVVKFDSFDGDHPKFDGYPFGRRTRVVYDHAGHFGKHYPEVAKKDPAKRIPATCSSCHNSSDDKRMMMVAPFEKTCATCHLDQIVGKERVSGPKGIAFLSLPGFDLDSLKKKNATIGDWPNESEASLTPFMKVMISQTARGRALLKSVDSVNLQDLSQASADQIKAVTDLAWEIKALFHAMILGKASDVLGNLNLGGDAKLSASLVADLTASMPRDVLISAQQQWLPTLAAEMANRRVTGDQANDGWAAVAPDTNTSGVAATDTQSAAPVSSNDTSDGADQADTVSQKSDTDGDGSGASKSGEAPSGQDAQQAVKRDPPACMVRVLGQCLMAKGQDAGGAAASSDKTLPPAMRAGLGDVRPLDEPQRAIAGVDKPMRLALDQAQSPSNDAKDELLFPTEDEQREMKAVIKGGAKSVGPPTTSSSSSQSNGQAAGLANGPSNAAPVISIESDVDPESWAEFGGWYRQDNAIFYRPTGHKDKFIYTWLFLTGPQAQKNDPGPSAAVFNYLTSKDAQGSCTKCHSIDDLQGKGRVVNFSPASAEMKRGRFTTFLHEPHFGTMENRGCLTCHNLEKGRATLKSYEQGDPHIFDAEFSAVKKDLCQSCHTASKARNDCLTCHKYHVNGAITPIMSTKIPIQ